MADYIPFRPAAMRPRIRREPIRRTRVLIRYGYDRSTGKPVYQALGWRYVDRTPDGRNIVSVGYGESPIAAYNAFVKHEETDMHLARMR